MEIIRDWATPVPEATEVSYMLYFAYGSNMNDKRMLARVPYASKIGIGVLSNWKLVERLYTDIEVCHNSFVAGVVWDIGDRGILELDRCEGYPHVYTGRHVDIDVYATYWKRPRTLECWTYYMTSDAIQARAFMPFPDEYRKICQAGAKMNGLSGEFFNKKVR